MTEAQLRARARELGAQWANGHVDTAKAHAALDECVFCSGLAVLVYVQLQNKRGMLSPFDRRGFADAIAKHSALEEVRV